jgi:peroxiredoxin
MKILYYLFIAALISLTCVNTTDVYAKDGLSVKLKVKGVQDTLCYLAYHYGHKIFIHDTFPINDKGVAHLKANEELPDGIYLAVLPGKQFFEFLLTKNEQKFTIETDTSDFINKMKVTGSNENKLFNDYQRFLFYNQQKIKTVKTRFDLTEHDDSLAIFKDDITELELELNEYRKKIIEKNEDSFLAAIFKTMSEPEVPEEIKNKKEQTLNLQYYKIHFWDNIDFNDERLIRTPIIYNKIKQYLEKLTVKMPDSINVAVDVILTKAKVNDKAFRYALSYITHTYETSKIMGMDAVFVHLAQKYYLNGDASWMDSLSIVKVKERVERLKYNLIGKIAPELKMTNLNGTGKQSLHEIKAEYVLMLFWDYDCGHCKKQMPEFLALYDRFKKEGLEVYAVCNKIEKEKIDKYIDENKLIWINVYDPDYKVPFRQWYDIHSTPTTYLLDKDKKIVAKRLGVAQITNILEQAFKEKEIKKEDQ